MKAARGSSSSCVRVVLLMAYQSSQQASEQEAQLHSTQCSSSSTDNYFTLITPSGNSSSCSLMQTKILGWWHEIGGHRDIIILEQLEKVSCPQIRKFLCGHLVQTIVNQCCNVKYSVACNSALFSLLKDGNEKKPECFDAHQSVNLPTCSAHAAHHTADLIKLADGLLFQSRKMLTFSIVTQQ